MWDWHIRLISVYIGSETTQLKAYCLKQRQSVCTLPTIDHATRTQFTWWRGLFPVLILSSPGFWALEPVLYILVFSPVFWDLLLCCFSRRASQTYPHSAVWSAKSLRVYWGLCPSSKEDSDPPEVALRSSLSLSIKCTAHLAICTGLKVLHGSRWWKGQQWWSSAILIRHVWKCHWLQGPGRLVPLSS